MYFADGGSTPCIVRARLDGSERINFVSNITGKEVKSPYGVAVDHETGTLWWCDKDLDIIEMVQMDGTRTKVPLDQVADGPGLTDCMSLAVYGEYVYWADR